MLANVVELVDHHHVVGMTGIGDTAESRNDGVVGMAEVAAGEHRRRMNRYRFDDDHRCAAAGALLVVGAVALAGHAGFRHVGRVGAKDEPVLERLVTQRERLEEMGEALRHNRSTSLVRRRRRAGPGQRDEAAARFHDTPHSAKKLYIWDKIW